MTPTAGRRAGISRRRCLLTAAALAVPVRPAHAAGTAPVLTGTSLALVVGLVPIPGSRQMAIGVNGTVPAPILHWREGDTVTVAVTNRLTEPTSIHWHGLRVPAAMDGVPGFSFPGIPPGGTFVYRLPLLQAGTYWYHGHSGGQEQRGLYGAIVIDPRQGYPQPFDRDYVVLLSDRSEEMPEEIVSNLKVQSDYYNRGGRTMATFFTDIRRQGLSATISNRLEWGKMRMSPTDILDVSGATYTYLINGQPPGANWTALFRPGERVRLRFINGSAMTLFDVRIPGLAMTVVQADGNDIAPVTIDEFRFAPGETYDVIVQPDTDAAFGLFAQAMDRSGHAFGTLAPRAGMIAPTPPMDPRPLRTMADMGMAGMEHGEMPDMRIDPARLGVTVDNVAMMPANRLNEPGTGLEDNGRRVLTYGQLQPLRPTPAARPTRVVALRLTGNMARYIWGFDGVGYADAAPIAVGLGERVRFAITNDTMMEHPIHLHGFWSELETTPAGPPLLKHTIIVKPGEMLRFLVTFDVPGRWAFHCHMLYHMDTGMFREVRVA